MKNDVNKHAGRSHALLSASGSSRWLNCTPSARLEEEFGEKSVSGNYAQEGTLAHEHAELDLKVALGIMTPVDYSKAIVKIRQNDLYNDGMPDEIQMYVDYCMEIVAKAKAVTKFARVSIEEKIDLQEWIPEGFGSTDFSVIADGTLYIVDFKYGKGIRVDAQDNSQLKLYALGALRQNELEFNINQVCMVIVQPRLDHISEFIISADELRDWGEVTVKHKAELAYKGEGEQNTGSWCQWCKIKARCSKLAEVNLERARMDFSDTESEKDPALLSDEEVILIFQSAKAIYSWLEAVEAHVLTQALNGKTWPGYKLVEGRSTRRWLDEQKVIQTLEIAGYTPDQYIKSHLEGIGTIEKLVGKKVFPAMFESLVVRPTGKPTLVTEDDKRQALPSNAFTDFSDSLE